MPFLAAPWTDRGFTYATNGCLIVRIPASPSAAFTANPLTDPAEKLFADHPAPAEEQFEPLPASVAKSKAMIPCRECHGSGAVLKGKKVPCLCPCCLGEKDEPNTRGIVIGHREFAVVLLLPLVTLPGLRIAAQTGGIMHPLRFAFEGGEGLLMPRKPQS